MNISTLFKIQQRKTSIKTEILAGLTTFMTMAYIVTLNPSVLTNFAVYTPLWNGIFLGTCFSSALAMFFMAFVANKPYALAPGMGINSFFAFVTAQVATLTGFSYTHSFQVCLSIILIEGLLFVILSLCNIRQKIITAIPLCIRLGIGPAIGLMLMNIGWGSNCGIYTDKGPFYVMKDFFGALSNLFIRNQMGEYYPQMVLTVLTIMIGLFTIIFFNYKKIKSAVLLGMFISSLFYWSVTFFYFGTNPFTPIKIATWLPPFHDFIETTFFKFNMKDLFQIGTTTVITLILTFCIIDLFDSIGTVVGVAHKINDFDEKGEIPQIKEALLSDATGTVFGSLTGTSTITTFLESTSGIEAGGRTGLTSLTTGILFLLCIFLAPLAGIIPAPATSSALIYVGILMLTNLKQINFDDLTQATPVLLMVLAMPISGSIGNSIGLGMISYTIIHLLIGKKKEIPLFTYIFSIIFLIKFFL